MSNTAARDRRFCRRCDYDLSASDGPLCPECGRAYSPGDPKTFFAHPRRSWKSRWRRYRWLTIPVLLLVAAWPKGWVLLRVTWFDPVTGGTVSSDSLMIAHPWWTSGFYAPIGRTNQSQDAAFAAPPASSQNVRLTIDLWRNRSIIPWHQEPRIRSQLAVLPPDSVLSPGEWTAKIRRYTRVVGDASGQACAPINGIYITAPSPDWNTTSN